MSDVKEDEDVTPLAELLDKPDKDITELMSLIEGFEEIIPLPPVWTGGTISLGQEDFKSTVEAIWKAIKEFIISILDSITTGTATLHLANIQISDHSETVRMNARSARVTKGPLVMNRYVSSLSTLYVPPKSFSDVINGLRNRRDVLNAYLTYLDNSVSRAIREIDRLVSSLRDGSGDAKLSLIADILYKSDPSNVLPKTIRPTLDTNMTHYWRSMCSSTHLIGNQRLFITNPVDRERYDLRVASLSTIRLDRSLVTPRPLPPTVTMSRAGINTADMVLDQVDKTADVISDGLKAIGERERALKQLLRTLDRFEQQVVRGEITDFRSGDVEQILGVGKTLTQWSASSFKSFIGSTLTSMRGAVALCEDNLK